MFIPGKPGRINCLSQDAEVGPAAFRALNGSEEAKGPCVCTPSGLAASEALFAERLRNSSDRMQVKFSVLF